MNKLTDNPRNVTKPLNICSDFHLGRHFFGLVGGFIVGLSVTLPHEVQIIKMLSKMKTIKLWRIAFVMLAAFSLASCSSDDDNEDKVEQVTLYVSAETGTYQNVPDNNYVEGMLIKENGAANWECVSFMEITGFTYERGHEYELLVKRTTLANPPQDSGKYRYELVRIVSDNKVE